MSKSTDFLPACENDPTGLLQALHPLRRLAEAGISFLLAHRTRKAYSVSDLAARVSSVLTAFADILVELRCLNADDPAPAAAFLAISFRFFAESDAARALPPFKPRAVLTRRYARGRITGFHPEFIALLAFTFKSARTVASLRRAEWALSRGSRSASNTRPLLRFRACSAAKASVSTVP